MECKFEEIIEMHLSPQNQQDQDKMRSLIDDAIVISPERVADLKIIYLMNIQSYDPHYLSLVFDMNGMIYKFKWTSKKLSELIFIEHGFSYDAWSRFLRQTLNREKTIFPYVYGNTVYLRLPVANQKNNDWINLSYHTDISFNSKELSFNYILNNSPKGKLKITFTDKIAKVAKQLTMSSELIKIWYQYQSQHLSKSYRSLQLNFDNFNDTSLFNHSSMATLISQHIQPAELEIFEQYAHIWDYMKKPKSKKSLKINQLLGIENLKPPIHQAVKMVMEVDTSYTERESEK